MHARQINGKTNERLLRPCRINNTNLITTLPSLFNELRQSADICLTILSLLYPLHYRLPLFIYKRTFSNFKHVTYCNPIYYFALLCYTDMSAEHPFFIFYIGHILDPFLLYSLTKNRFWSIGVPVLWEIIEYSIYSVFGNYSPLFLEFDEKTDSESLTDILVYDIGGAIVAVAYAHVLYKALRIENKARVRLSWQTWTEILPLLAKVLLLSPMAALGWECRPVVESWCQSNGYHLLPWGMFAIVPVNTAFILYYFESKRWWIAGSAWLLFATAFQRIVPGAPLALSIFTFFTIAIWLYGLFQNNKNYQRIGPRDDL